MAGITGPSDGRSPSLSSPNTPCFLPTLEQTPCQGLQATQMPATKHWQGHCHLPEGNSNFPRNLPGKRMAAVPHALTSACLSTSALGDSKVAGMPALAPNPQNVERRDRGQKNPTPTPPKKTPTSTADNLPLVTFFFLIKMVWRKHLAVAPV